MTNQQKGFVLIGLFLAWGGIMAYQLSDNSESTGDNFVSTLPQANKNLPSVKALSLNQAFPNTRQLVTFSQPRNIFAPIGLRKVSTKPNVSITAPIITPKNAQASPAPPPALSASDLAAQRARQQLNQFRFLGYLTRGGESQAFLTNGQAIYIVKQGEMLEGHVQVNKIEPETIVLSTQILETGNHVQAAIPLTPETHG